MAKRILVFGIFFVLVLSGGYAIDLKHTESFDEFNLTIDIVYYFNVRPEWVSNTGIFHSGSLGTQIYDLKQRRNSMLINKMQRVKASIVFKNEEILLLKDNFAERNNGQEYYIYSFKTKKIYPLDKEGTEQYLADGGKEYEYYSLVIEEDKRWEYYLRCYKITIPNMTSTRMWTENAEEVFQTEIIGRFYLIEQYSDTWLVEMRQDLYLIQFDESGVKTSYMIQNNIGTSGVFLKDGRILASYCPVDEDPFYRGGEESYLKLAVFNSKGELEQTIDKEIYVVDGTKMMSISPDGTKLLVMGYDKDHDFNNDEPPRVLRRLHYVSPAPTARLSFAV